MPVRSLPCDRGAADQIRYHFLDGWYPKVWLGGRRARVPVLVALGVRATGERVAVDVQVHPNPRT